MITLFNKKPATIITALIKFLFAIYLCQSCSFCYGLLVYRPIIQDTGLYFYDVESNQTLLPPIVSSPVSKINFPIGQRCDCDKMDCNCCAGIRFQRLNVDRRVCTNFTYEPKMYALSMGVTMNGKQVMQNSFSLRAPPPLCLPLNVPYIPLSMDMCIKLFDISTPGANLHMCMDWSARVEMAPIIVLHFDCMQIGLDGVSFLKPGQTPPPPTTPTLPSWPSFPIFGGVTDSSNNQQGTGGPGAGTGGTGGPGAGTGGTGGAGAGGGSTGSTGGTTSGSQGGETDTEITSGILPPVATDYDEVTLDKHKIKA